MLRKGPTKELTCQGGNIRNIHLYHDGRVWLEIGRGWFEHTGPGESWTRDVVEVDVGEPVRAIKANLGRDVNFWMKHQPKYKGDLGCELYVWCKPVVPMEVVTGESDLEVRKAQAFLLPFQGRFQDGEWVGAIRFVGGLRVTQPTAFGQVVANVARNLKLDGISTSGGWVGDILRLYTVERKCPVRQVVGDDAGWETVLSPCQVERLLEERAVYRDVHKSDQSCNWFMVDQHYRANRGAGWKADLLKMAGGT